MARLPVVGGDEGNWGQILNEYLSESLSADGSLNIGTVGSVQLRPNAVTGSALADGTVTSSKIADGAVTTSKISGLASSDGIATLDDTGVLPEGQLPSRLSESRLRNSYGTLKRPTLVLFGDSRTADCDYSSGTLAYSTNMSWIDWGQSSRQGGPTFDILRNAGIGGNTTQQMLDRVDADVIAYAPSHVTVWGGTNDGWTTTSMVDASFGRMKQIVQKLTDAGIFVFLISETTGSPPLRSTPFPALVGYYNDLLRTLAVDQPGIEYWDFNAAIVDPTNGNGYARGAMLRDGLHLGPYGASKIGRDVVGPRLEKHAANLANLSVSQYDTKALVASSRNIVNNPLMQGTGGSIGSGHSGSLPSNWASSGNAAALSIASRTDGFGNNAKVVLSASSTSTFFLSQQIDQNRVVPGKRYVIEASLSISDATNISAVSLTFSLFETGGIEHRRGFGYPVQAVVAGDSVATGDRILRSRVFTAPSPSTGSFNGCSLTLRISPSASGGTATVELGRVSVRQLD